MCVDMTDELFRALKHCAVHCWTCTDCKLNSRRSLIRGLQSVLSELQEKLLSVQTQELGCMNIV